MSFVIWLTGLVACNQALVLDDARRNYDVSVVPSEWICEEHYNEVYATKIWLRPR